MHGDLVDTYPVQIHERDLTIEVNVAIEDGIWWLHQTQEGDGGWGSNGNYRAGSTASAIHAMEINGHVSSRSTVLDPLVEDVVRGLGHMFAQLSPTAISVQAFGDPDSNGNGIGVGVNSARPIYEGGMVMDAIAASGLPDAVASAGPGGVRGRAYRDILQDMVDMYAWGQVDAGNARGGWRYDWNGGADNSACQWAAIGVHGAKTFGLDAPEWVKEENDVWLNYSYNGTGFGYDRAGNGQATTPSGMVQLSFAGFGTDDPRWITSENWLANNWLWYKNLNDVYAWYAFAKAMRLARPAPVANLSATGLDWYHDEDGLIRYILNRQDIDGGWPDYYGRQFATAWQVIILTPTLFTRPPVAVAGNDIVWAFDRPLVFDGSGSYHTDPVRLLVQYEWDFDGNGVYDYIGADPVVDHTFAYDDAITYPITYQSRLRVTDDIGQTDTDTRAVTIAEPPHAPFADAGGPYTVGEGVPFHPDGSGSYDIDPTDYITRMEWDFDGSDGYDFDNPDAAVDCPAPPEPCPPVTWSFPAQGTYYIGLRVWDNAVLHPDEERLPSLPDFTTVTVGENDAPVADAGGPYETVECQGIQLDGSASYDPNGDGISYLWDLDNDGEFDDATGPAPTFVSNDDGVYTVLVTVTDGSLTSEPASADVTVHDTGPEVSLSGPDTLLISQSGTFQAEVVSPCDDVRSIEWDWDYNGFSFAPSGDTGATHGHTYNAHGTYLVAVRVTDEDDSTAMATHDVTVASPAGPRAPADHLIRIVVGPRDYDDVEKIHRGQFSLVSEDDAPITGPVVLAFREIVPSTVTLLGVDGYVPDPDDPQRMIPYIDFSDLLTGNVLHAGETIGPKWIEFSDPDNVAFTFVTIPFVFNAAPKIVSTPVLEASEGSRYRYDVDATDANGDPIRFALSDTNGAPPPAGMTIHPVHGLIDWVPGQRDAGLHAVTVVADDGLPGGQDQQTYTITASEVNVAPVITSAPMTTSAAGEVYTYVVEAYDPDGDPITYALMDGPAGMTIDADTGLIQWMAEGSGTKPVELMVSDDHARDTTQAFLLTVLACAEPPVITSVPVVHATEGVLYTYPVEAIDGGGLLFYSLPVAPIGMTIDQMGLIEWTPSYTAHGFHTVKVRVTNDLADCHGEQIFQIDVTDANAAPQFITTAVTTASEGIPYRYASQAIDPDGDTVAYALVQGPAGMTIDPVAGVVEWTPSQMAAAMSPYTIVIEASDPTGAATQQPFQIEVASEELAPRIISTPVYGAVENELYVYDVEAVDPDGDVLAYALAVGPAGMTIDPNTGMTEWLPNQTAAQHNPYSVQVVVSDPLGHTVTQAFKIFVRVTNVAPVFTSDPVTEAVEGEIYHYFPQASDEDGDTLMFELMVAPGGMSIHPSTGHVSWLVPQTAAVDGPHDVTIVVSDGIATGEQSFAITAEQVNSAPVIYSTPVTAAAIGAHYTYDVDANDLDGDLVSYGLDTAPTGMTIDPGSGLIDWDPQAGQDGEHDVTVVASDPFGLSSTQAFAVDVAECADAPVFTSEPKTTASPLIAYVYDVEAEVATGTVTFALSEAPAEMLIDADTGVITWTPTELQMGVHDVSIVALRDAVCPSIQSFQVDVRECELAVSYGSPLLVPNRFALVEPQIDANCEPLTFALASGPTGMTVDPATGAIGWTPEVGLYDALIEVTDAWGTSDQVTFAGEVFPEEPPTITSIPPFTAMVDALYEYQVEATDPDNDTLEYSLPTAPAGMTIDGVTGLVTWTPGAGDIGSHDVAAMVDDLRGWQVTQSYVLTVSLTGENEPPEIASTPTFAAAAGFTYTYQVVASDPNGEALDYSLDEAPAGMTIDPVTGLVSWETTEADAGDHTITVRATDPWQAWAYQSFTLRVYVNTPPQIVSSPPINAIAEAAYVYAVVVVDPDEATLAYQLALAPAGMTIDAATGVVTWTPTVDQVGEHDVSVVVADSTLASDTQDFTITVHADANADVFPPHVTITVNPTVVHAGEPVTITVIATDDLAVASVTLTVNGQPVALVGTLAVYTPGANGSYIARAVATDLVGQTGQATADFFARTPGDHTPPTVAITSPAIDAVLSAPTEIIGTASDDNLHKYTLAYRRAGDDDFTEFATGYESVVDGVLGMLDTTLLMNGVYDIRLRALDTNGQIMTLMTAYTVEGHLKVGNFTMTFVDLEIPLAGIPITLQRSYDSRSKSTDDYGYGWSFDLHSLKIEENKQLAADWQQSVGGSIIHTYQLSPIRTPIVTVTWPDGHVDRFVMTVNPAAQAFFPLDFFSSVSFVPVPPTKSSLGVIGDTSGWYDGGAPMYGGPPTQGNLRFYNGDLLDPANYRLTTQEGMVYTFTGDWSGQISGLQNITDRNDNQLQILPDGIVHSSGVRVDLERDAEGRITKITDPEGGEIRFEYDARGDLIAVTNRDDLTTRFTYNDDHYLLEVIDPTGRGVARNIYDDSGRLIATVDADGRRIEFEHNIDTRQEVITDRLGRVTVHEYDEHGNIVATTDAEGYRWEHTYDDQNRELTNTDPLGRVSNKTYDDDGNVLTNTDFDGHTTSYTYRADGKPLTVTDPEGNVQTRVYDTDGNITQTIDQEGAVTTLTVDDRGQLIAETDPLGNVTLFSHDTQGNLVSQTDPLGNVATFTYDGLGNQRSETHTRTRLDGSTEEVTRTFDYNGRDLPVTMITPGGAEGHIEYASIDRVASITNDVGQVFDFEYDAYGNVTVAHMPNGTTRRRSYDAEGNLLSETNPNGNVAERRYDKLDRKIQTINPDGTSTHTTYDGAGRVLTYTDERGHVTTYEYPPNQQRVTDALGNITVYEYDGNGRPVRTADANGHVFVQEYDGRGQPTRMTYADGSTTETTYDAVGRKLTETDAAGRTTHFTYDAAGQLVAVVDAKGGMTIFTYDEVGNKTSQTDAEGRTTLMEYDSAGRMTKRIIPLGQEEHFEYDEAGRVARHIDFNGAITTSEYGLHGQLSKRTYADDTFVEYDYALDLQRAMAGGDTYEYDACGRLIRETKAGGEVLTYTYDGAGNRTSVTTSEGTTTYTYDALDRLATVTDPDGGVTLYAYDAVGNRASVTYANGVRTTYTYDTLNRLIHTETVNTATSEVISSYTYTLGSAGNRTRAVELSGRTVDYTYDDLYRLVREDIADPAAGVITITYTYDAVGNRLSKTVVTSLQTTTTVYVYDDNDRLLSEQTTLGVGQSYSPETGVRYASAGRYVPQPSANATYIRGGYIGATLAALLIPCGLIWSGGPGRRARRRRAFIRTVSVMLLPTMILTPKHAQAAHTEAMAYEALMAALIAQTPDAINYAYDDNGNLIHKTNGINETDYTYDPADRLASVTDGGQTTTYTYDADDIRTSQTTAGVTTTFVTDKNRPYAQVLVERTDTDAVTYVHGDDLISMTRPGDVKRYYQHDGLLSVRQLTTDTGTVSDTYDYDAFGVLLGTSGSTINHYRYAGEQYDPNAGFYYLRARYYDQNTGRFTTRDAFHGNPFDPASLHKYTYAHADPVNNVDPSGRALTLMESLVVMLVISILAGLFVGILVANETGDPVEGFVAGLWMALCAPLLMMIIWNLPAMPGLMIYMLCYGLLSGVLAAIGDAWPDKEVRFSSFMRGLFVGLFTSLFALIFGVVKIGAGLLSGIVVFVTEIIGNLKTSGGADPDVPRAFLKAFNAFVWACAPKGAGLVTDKGIQKLLTTLFESIFEDSLITGMTWIWERGLDHIMNKFV